MSKSKRGGARNTGRCMSFNTSGLPAIGFGITVTGVKFVRVAAGRRRTAYSTSVHGKYGALRKAIKYRRDAGLPAPSFAGALRAFAAYDWRAAARRVGAPVNGL